MEAAFFDLDKTVIAKASMVAFGRPLLRAGMISRPLLLRALWNNLVFHYLGAGEDRMRKFRESALRVTRGWEQAHISALVRDNLTEVIDPIVYDEALALIEAHKAAGRRVFIVSASPEEIVAPLARYLGVDQAIASRARIDDQGRYTGEVAFYSYGPYKAEAMREVAALQHLDLDASYAYSDSITDLPMLEAVGHPVVVNPDRELARIARDRDWEVRIFRQGVELRERVSMPARRRIAAVAVVIIAAAGGGAGVWWWIRRRPMARSVPDPRWRREIDAALEPLRAGGLRRPGASSPRGRRGQARRARR